MYFQICVFQDQFVPPCASLIFTFFLLITLIYKTEILLLSLSLRILRTIQAESAARRHSSLNVRLLLVVEQIEVI